MAFLDYFRKSRSRSAEVAKDRLSIIVAREHGGARGKLKYLPQLKQELLQVIAKYERIDLDQVTVNVEHNGNCEVLELNVILSEFPKTPVAPNAPFFTTPSPKSQSATTDNP
ncbi:MAG TPA: cell division topological specificity factor MinE [Polyangiaceae bacterium]|jgi:cell division topological specificity factor